MRHHALSLAIAVAAVFAVSFYAAAQLGGSSGVRIPYNGTLELDGAPATGTFDFRLSVFNQAANGVACDEHEETTLVSSGNFAIVLGPVDENCVRGRDVFLEIEVSSDANAAGYTALPGRQRIYAASSASTSGTGDFAVQGLLTTNTLDVVGLADVGSLSAGSISSETVTTTSNIIGANTMIGDVGHGAGFAGLKHKDAPLTSSYGFLQSSNGLSTFMNAGPGGSLFFRTNNLDRATLNSSGTLSTGPGISPGASERLRIVRGTVNANGSANRGAGYTVSRPANGVFDVVFNPAFSGTPSVVCTAIHPSAGNQPSGSGGCMPSHPNNTTANGFRAIVTAGSQANANFPFSFVAIGPG